MEPGEEKEIPRIQTIGNAADGSHLSSLFLPSGWSAQMLLLLLLFNFFYKLSWFLPKFTSPTVGELDLK